MAPDGRIQARWRAFFDGPASDAVREFLGQYPSERSFYADVVDLHRFDAAFVEALFSAPDEVLRRGAEVLQSVDDDLGRVNVRLRNLPSQLGIRNLRSRHVGTLVSIEGIVRSVDSVGATVAEAVFRCRGCGATRRVRPRGVEPPEPGTCAACDSTAPPVLDREGSTFVDLQRVELAEPDDAGDWAGTPRRIDVYLDDDLVDAVGVPDSVLVTGVVRLARRADANRFDFYVDALTVEAQRAGPTRDDVDAPEQLKESIRSRWEFVVGE